MRTAVASARSFIQPALWPGAVLLLVGLALLLLHREALVEWYGRSQEDRYSHAPIVILVAAYLFWVNAPARTGGDRTSWYGVLLTLIGGAALVLGELSALWMIVQYGLVLTLMGMAWAYYGREFRSVYFPFLLAFTAIPLPYMVDVVLTGKMQLLSSGLGVEMLRMLNVSVHQKGNLIDLGAYKLHVAEACSGLNYMFPLFAIGLIVASFYKGPLLVRGLLVASTVPITILMNSARIAVVGLLVNAQGSQAAEGFSHYFEGWIVFMLCLMFLTAEVAVANRFLPARSRLTFHVPPLKRQRAADDAVQVKRSLTQPVIAAMVLAIGLSLLTSRIGGREEIIPSRKTFFDFPMSVQGWEGSSYPFTNGEQQILGLTDYVLADFARKTDRANLYIGYVQSQRKGFVPHSPKACIPGGGWEISDAGAHTFQTSQGSFQATKLIISNAEERQLVYYWFRQRGRDLPGEYSLKWYLLVDSIQKDRTDGALVRVIVPVRTNMAEAEKVAESFVKDIYGELPAFIPN
jgi:exosortase D (VPLPA-CTERM-specific)